MNQTTTKTVTNSQRTVNDTKTETWNAPKLRKIPAHGTKGTGKPTRGGESGITTGLS